MKLFIYVLSFGLAAGTGATLKEAKLTTPDGEAVTIRASSMRAGEPGVIMAGGSIEARHGSVTIKCVGTMRVLVSGDTFRALDARGGVEATAGSKKLWGQRAFYDEPRRLITMSGFPRAQDGKTMLRAEKRILYYADSGLIKCEPTAQFFVERDFKSAKSSRKRKRFLGIF